jgi:hypothetical protein
MGCIWDGRGEVQAFSDFFFYILESQSIISDWALGVCDNSSGYVDVYKGKDDEDEEERTVDHLFAASNTTTLRYSLGHYQPLMPNSTRPALKNSFLFWTSVLCFML